MKKTPDEDPLADWTWHHRAAFDELEPRADLWARLESQLPPAPVATAADELHTWLTTHRAALDTLEPRPALWGAIARQLDEEGRATAPSLRVSRGGAWLRSWGRVAAAAVVAFGFGYALRVQTEPAPASVATTADARPRVIDDIPAPTYFRNAGGFHSEPDPALNAALLTAAAPTDDDAPVATATVSRPDPDEIAPEVTRLEARYHALLARRRAELRRIGPSRPLADEWDREMAVLDSTYAELRRELTRNPNTDDVVEAMTRNLHLRMDLLDQQARTLEAVQQARHRAERRVVPHRPPSVNPEGDEPSGFNPDRRPASPAPVLPVLPPAAEPRFPAGSVAPRAAAPLLRTTRAV